MKRFIVAIGCLIAGITAGESNLAFAQNEETQEAPSPGDLRPAIPGPAAPSPENTKPALPQASVPTPLPSTTFDLATFQAIALQRNPSMSEACARLQAARGKWVQVGLAPNPTVGYSGQQIGSRGEADQHGVIIGQQFITGHKLRLNREIAAQDVRKAEQYHATQRLRVMTDVAITYYEALAAQEKLDLAVKLLEVGRQAQTAAERLLKAGESTKIDLLQAGVEADTAKIGLDNARARYDAAWRKLAAVTAMTEQHPERLAADWDAGLADLEWETSLHKILDSSPEVSAAVSEVERTRWAYQRALKQACPDIDVQGIVQYDNQIRSTDGAIQVTMPFPLFDRNQGGVREAYYNVATAERRLERLKLDLQDRLASVFERYAAASRQAERYRNDVIPAAAEQIRLVQSAYANGEIAFLPYLTAQRTYFQTTQAVIDSLRDRAVANQEIEGMLLRDSLTSVGER